MLEERITEDSEPRKSAKVDSSHEIPDSEIRQTATSNTKETAWLQSIQKVPAELRESVLDRVLESLTTENAKDQCRWLFSCSNNDDGIFARRLVNKIEGYSKQNGNIEIPLEQILASEAKEREINNANLIRPSPEALRKIASGLDRLEITNKRIVSFRDDFPDVKGTERWESTLDQLERRFRKGKQDAKVAQKVDSLIIGIAGVDSEILQARVLKDSDLGVLQEIRKPIRWQRKSSEVDLIFSAGDRYNFVDVKGGNAPNRGTPRYQDLLEQAETQIYCMNNPEYFVDGNPPKLVYCFSKELNQETIEGLRAAGIEIV